MLKTMQFEMLSGDKDTDADTDTDKDLEDEENGELGAVEALTQLRPRNDIIVSREGNLIVNERFKDSNCQGSLRSQIRRGIRSVRRTTSGYRPGNGSSPYRNGTSTKGQSNEYTEKISSRKILDFYDEHHESLGQSRATPDFLPSKRSSRMHSRRKRKFTELGALNELDSLKCQDALSKSNNSRPHICSNSGLKLAKDMRGRWATERYKSAQLKLIDIMHQRGAAPGKPILRPALREEARKDIGDTGLLDHLLKHMTDTVIANGERFRRRHNAEGAMEYWLEDASLMEIRKAANIEDPSWIPPPGWKPGDVLLGRGDYGYGCFNQGMTPAEVAELKKLKEKVYKVRSDLQSLSLQVTRSRSRETRTPELKLKEGLQEEEHKTTTENDQEARSTCKISTEAKSQLEMDLSAVQKSVAIIEDYVHFTMMGLGLSQAEHTKLTSTEGNSGAIESRSLITCQLGGRDPTSAPEHPARIALDTTNCFARTSSPADHQMSREEIDRSKRRVQADSFISCGNEPNRRGHSRPSSGVNWGIQTEVETYTAPARRCFGPGGMIIPQRGAFSAWTEGVLSPGTPPATSTAPYVGHSAATSREDASARVLYSITRSDSKDQFTPNFQPHANFCLPSTDSVVGERPQVTVLPDHYSEHNRIKGMTAEGSQFRATCFKKIEAHASVWVHRKPAKARDIQLVSRNQLPNLTHTSNSFVGSTPEYSPAITAYPDATQCRLFHQGQTYHLPMRSGTQSAHTSGDYPQSFLSAVTAAHCDASESLNLPSFSEANSSLDKTLANPSKDSGYRAEHLVLKAVLEMEQRLAPSEKHRMEGIRSTTQKSFHEIVVPEKCSKAKSSAWLGLAPPNTNNLHSADFHEGQLGLQHASTFTGPLKQFLQIIADYHSRLSVLFG